MLIIRNLCFYIVLLQYLLQFSTSFYTSWRDRLISKIFSIMWLIWRLVVYIHTYAILILASLLIIISVILPSSHKSFTYIESVITKISSKLWYCWPIFFNKSISKSTCYNFESFPYTLEYVEIVPVVFHGLNYPGR